MDQKLDDQLCKDYPALYRDRHADMGTTCMCWGFCCRDGWFPLIRELSEYIQWCLDSTSYKDGKKGVTNTKVIVDQVKEKFGMLRFYYHYEDDNKTPKEDEFIDTEHTEYVVARINGAISFAECLSGTICELCGTTYATCRTEEGRWITTSCNDCRKRGKTPQ